MSDTKKWDIGVHGDWLEKNAVQLIRDKIPAYEQIWTRFIGNDGTAQMVKIKGLPKEINRQRVDFAEHHYTILESLFLMSRVQKVEELKQTDSFDAYTEALNNMILFQAYAGRIRDNIEACYSSLGEGAKGSKASARFKKTYYKRSIVMHCKKLPFKIDEDGSFHIARPSEEEQDTLGFDKGKLWEDSRNSDMINLGVFQEDCFNTIVQEVNSQLEALLKIVKKIVQEKNIVMPEPPEEDQYIDCGNGGKIKYIGRTSSDYDVHKRMFNTPISASGDVGSNRIIITKKKK